MANKRLDVKATSALIRSSMSLDPEAFAMAKRMAQTSDEGNVSRLLRRLIRQAAMEGDYLPRPGEPRAAEE